MEQTFIIFKEAFFARLLPIFQEVALTAEKNFHAEHYGVHSIVAAVGALLASALLFLFGVWLRRIPRKISTAEQQARVEKMQGVAHEWLPWLLILSPMPVGSMLIIAAGFFRTRPRLAIFVIVVAEIIWRALPFVRQA